jgi:CRISPR system Cascade subunit CasD
MTSSVYIRLAGPLQSWAKPAVSGNYVNTAEIPTVTALQGLIAGGLGYTRGNWPEWISKIDFIVREERRPKFVDDFQTIGSREDEKTFRHRLALMQGLNSRAINPPTHKPGVAATTIAQRTYLSDSEFIVQMTLEGHTEDIDSAVSSPVFVNYLGRKAFSPSFPYYLGVGDSDGLSRIPTIPQTPGAAKKATVFQYFLSMGNDIQPTRVAVPAVGGRTQWLDSVEALGFKRHNTLR